MGQGSHREVSTMPADGPTMTPKPTAMAAPATAATSSRRPVMSEAAMPAMAAGKMMSMPSRVGSGMPWPPRKPTRLAANHMGTMNAVAIQ